VTDELTRPELGYVKQPYEVYRLEDFTAGQIDRAAAEPEKYSAALVFSTKYDPPVAAAQPGREERSAGRAILRPAPRPAARGDRAAAARHAGLAKENHAMWVALLRFNRQIEASAQPPELREDLKGR
jgi:hypothetical protein